MNEAHPHPWGTARRAQGRLAQVAVADDRGGRDRPVGSGLRWEGVRPGALAAAVPRLHAMAGARNAGKGPLDRGRPGASTGPAQGACGCPAKEDPADAASARGWQMGIAQAPGGCRSEGSGAMVGDDAERKAPADRAQGGPGTVAKCAGGRPFGNGKNRCKCSLEWLFKSCVLDGRARIIRKAETHRGEVDAYRRLGAEGAPWRG